MKQITRFSKVFGLVLLLAAFHGYAGDRAAGNQPALLPGLQSDGHAQATSSDSQEFMNELMDWAEKTYAAHFPGHQQTSILPPYVYRYYPQTGNYLGVADGAVYVLGPISNGALLSVGKVTDFTCLVSPSTCMAPSPPPGATIATNQFSTCALKNSSVVCWGAYPQPTRTEPDPFLPSVIPGISSARTISVGFDHACAVLETKQVQCWGKNNYYQLGLGTTEGGPAPAIVPGVENAVDVVAATEFSCALRATGTVTCWGRLYYWAGPGGLAVALQKSAVDVPALDDAVSLAAFDRHACATRKNGSVVCWGQQLVDFRANETEHNSAYLGLNRIAPVVGLTDAIAVTTGTKHSCALRSRRTVVCWGVDENYSLDGLNAYTDGIFSPVPVQGLTDVVAIAGAANSTCALRSNNTTVCWGQVLPSYAQLGFPPHTSSTPPAQVGALDGFSVLPRSNPLLHSCAAKVDGSIYCWGYNGFGQLGSRTSTLYSTPIRVPGF